MNPARHLRHLARRLLNAAENHLAASRTIIPRPDNLHDTTPPHRTRFITYVPADDYDTIESLEATGWTETTFPDSTPLDDRLGRRAYTITIT